MPANTGRRGESAILMTIACVNDGAAGSRRAARFRTAGIPACIRALIGLLCQATTGVVTPRCNRTNPALMPARLGHAEVRDTGAWGFTIGTAFFEKKFIPDGSFQDNMMAVWDWLQAHGIDG